MQARIQARGFATDFTSSTGDPLLATVRADAPATTPITLPPGVRATITVTLKPTGAVGTTASGILVSQHPAAGLRRGRFLKLRRRGRGHPLRVYDRPLSPIHARRPAAPDDTEPARYEPR
jgi:hypothetical protein